MLFVLLAPCAQGALEEERHPPRSNVLCDEIASFEVSVFKVYGDVCVLDGLSVLVPGVVCSWRVVFPPRDRKLSHLEGTDGFLGSHEALIFWQNRSQYITACKQKTHYIHFKCGLPMRVFFESLRLREPK